MHGSVCTRAFLLLLPISVLPYASAVRAEPAPSAQVHMQIDPAVPEVGQSARLSVTFESGVHVPSATGTLRLPDAFRLVEGGPRWTGELRAGAKTVLEFVVTAVAPPRGRASFELDLHDGEKDLASLSFEPAPRPRHRPEMSRWPDAGLLPGLTRGKSLPAGPAPAVELTLRAEPDAHGDLRVELFALANVAVSEGAITMGNRTAWRGGLDAGELLALEATVDRPASFPVPFAVSVTSAEVSLSRLYRLSPPGRESAAAVVGAPLVPAGEVPAGEIELTGRFVYDEDLSETRGITAARVNVFDQDEIGHDELVCSTTTDSEGYWSCSGSASDPGDDVLEIYATVAAFHPSYGNVRGPSGATYGAQTDVFELPEAGGFSAELGTWWPPFNETGGYWEDGAYHILRMAVYGNELTVQAGGEVPPSLGEEHFASFEWPDADEDSSSEYDDWVVYIEGPGAADADEWDESVVLHEYGHYLMNLFADWEPPAVDYCNSPGEVPPCTHSFTSHENPETAYIEGWADYYQSAVKRFWGLGDPHLYQETSWSFDIEASWHPAGGWDDAESTVAGILWDINDLPSDDQNADGIGDGIDLGHDENHAVFSLYDPPGFHGAPWNIHEFYEGFQTMHPYADAVRRIHWEHGVDKDTSPDPPFGPAPPDGAADVPPIPILSWSGSDPDGDSLTYTVHLEAGDPTPEAVVCDEVPASQCDPGVLEADETYHWYVVARDPFGKETAGPTWSFATCGDADGDGVPCGIDCDDGDPAVHPGAPEVNDGQDNQCPGDVGYGSVDEISDTVTASPGGELCWESQDGATSYQVAVSADPGFSASCTSELTASTCWLVEDPPAGGAVSFALVRAFEPHAGSWGRDSNGVERDPGDGCDARP